MSEALTESVYSTLASRELRALLDAIDALGDEAEAELASDILSIEYTDGSKTIINSHRAARQIWMAAGTTAWHFDRVGDRWVASKSGGELWQVLSAVLSKKLGRELELRAPSIGG